MTENYEANMATSEDIEKSQRLEKLLEAGNSGDVLRNVSQEEAMDHLRATIEAGNKIVLDQFLGIGTNSTMLVEGGRKYQIDKNGIITMLPGDAGHFFPMLAQEFIEKGIISEPKEFGQFVEVKINK